VLRELVVVGMLYWPFIGGAQIADVAMHAVTPNRVIASCTTPTEGVRFFNAGS